MSDWHLSRKGSIKDRLLAHRKIEGDCWIWTGSATRDGYGVLAHKGKQKRVHRLSYEEFIGEINEGFFVCHKCDTPLCFNPNHLFIGTPKENTIDSSKKGRLATIKGESHKNAKLKNADIKTILQLRNGGMKLRELSEIYGVSFQLISEITRGRRWNLSA